MANPALSTDIVTRVEQLVDLIGFRRQWDGPAYNGTAYEHVLPLFEATHQWIIFRNYRTNIQQSRKRALERAAAENWPEGSDPYARYHDNRLYRARIFITHLASIQSGFGPRDIPMSRWPIDRLILEYENAHIMRDNYKTIAAVLGGVGLGNRAVQWGAKRYALTAVLRVTGPVGTLASLGSAAIFLIAMRYEIKKIADIDIEVTMVRVSRGQISFDEWQRHERRIENKWGGEPEPEEIPEHLQGAE